MKRLYVLLSLVLLMIGVSAKAQDCLYVDYCGGEIAKAADGKSATKKYIEAAICLTPEMLKSVVGCQISGVNVGFPADSKFPETVTSWLRVGSYSNEKLAVSADYVPTTTGWNAILFTEPYTITGKEDAIYIGFRYYQASTLKCLSFVGSSQAGGAYLCTETTTTPTTTRWSDVSSAMGGVLSIQGIVTGDVPQHDLMLKNVRAKRNIVKLGEDIAVSGTVENNACKEAKTPRIRYSLDGKEMGVYNLKGETLAYREKEDFTITIPTTSYTEETTAKVELALEWSDGTADENPEDNVATLNVDLAKEVFLRKMVCEEGTGTWCGWCVRGYVGMKTMKEKYGEDFIGIGVHNSDEFVYAPYNNWMVTNINGFPSALINRDGTVYDPGFSTLEGALKAMGSIAEARVDVVANLDGDQLTMQSTVTMATSLDHEVRVAFVVLEDSVLTTQKNYYSGGGYGAMGGFEKLGSSAEVEMMDAARYISNPNGDANSVSLAPKKGEKYYYEKTVDLTSIGTNQVKNKKNLSVVAILIDQKTGEILNGEKTEDLSGTLMDGIRTVKTSPAQKGVYDLQGRRVTKGRKGMYIVDGKVRVY